MALLAMVMMIFTIYELCTVIVFNLMAHPSGQVKAYHSTGNNLPVVNLARPRVLMLRI